MKIQIADVTIELLNVDDYTKRISRDYITDKEHTDLTIAVSDQEIAQVEEENNLWKQYFGERAFVVNGDRPFLRRIDNTLYACGSPWCGKEGWSTNTMVPLKALCFLERGDSNKIERVSDAEVAERIFRQLRLPKDAEKMNKLLELLDWMVRNIPCYRLQCNMDLEAAEVAYNGMQEETL